MEGVIDGGLGLRRGVVILHDLAHRHAAMLGGEGNDRGGAAAGRRAGAGEEIVRRHDAEGGLLLDMAVAVDAAGKHQLALGVDLAAAPGKCRADCNNAPILDADVGADDVCRGCHRTPSHDELEFGHRPFLFRQALA